MTTNNFCFYLQNRLIQTSQTGGQQYRDSPPLVFPGWVIWCHITQHKNTHHNDTQHDLLICDTAWTQCIDECCVSYCYAECHYSECRSFLWWCGVMLNVPNPNKCQIIHLQLWWPKRLNKKLIKLAMKMEQQVVLHYKRCLWKGMTTGFKWSWHVQDHFNTDLLKHKVKF